MRRVCRPPFFAVPIALGQKTDLIPPQGLKRPREGLNVFPEENGPNTPLRLLSYLFLPPPSARTVFCCSKPPMFVLELFPGF